MSRRGKWSVQVRRTGGEWRTVFVCLRSYGEGWLDHHRESGGPRCAMRLLSPDGVIVATAEALDEVSVGMIAGWPTAEQYELAGETALAKAAAIRAAEQREAERLARRRGES